MKKGKVYLVPTFLSDSNDADFVSESVKDVIEEIQHYLVENTRTARRFISSLKLNVEIEKLQFFELKKGEEQKSIEEAFKQLKEGKDVGVISEAGLPAVADPGQLLVQKAQNFQFEVKTLPGASSMILGLIASGFNGQQYTFHGYLPIEKKDKLSKIKSLEKESNISGYTQIFMETPYRNDRLFKDLLNTLKSETMLFIGSDLTGKNEKCLTMNVKKWRGRNHQIGKVPTIFAIGKY